MKVEGQREMKSENYYGMRSAVYGIRK